eukprot:CAMPEP_0117744564 /NCGR_PEP_ID=MMETSP0947-20121206/6834_1 /TAXON_ID=44440 /ORGANISM="Chattonella subsalsa, Strain CCMP2191" /LENGTH=129 /DNA_ID=CAMNT_0005561537 /DNA_START=152 /DNA_END=541 /DNA_ORIENTATION=+
MESGEGKQDSALHVQLNQFSPVEIDEDCRQKYVLMKGVDTDLNSAFFVRGKKRAEFHVDAAESTVEAMEACGFATEITGGGRIEHSSSDKKILIYGYSMQFGLADHSKTASMIQEAYPDYEVEWNNDGY